MGNHRLGVWRSSSRFMIRSRTKICANIYRGGPNLLWMPFSYTIYSHEILIDNDKRTQVLVVASITWMFSKIIFNLRTFTSPIQNSRNNFNKQFITISTNSKVLDKHLSLTKYLNYLIVSVDNFKCDYKKQWIRKATKLSGKNCYARRWLNTTEGEPHLACLTSISQLTFIRDLQKRPLYDGIFNRWRQSEKWSNHQAQYPRSADSRTAG